MTECLLLALFLIHPDQTPTDKKDTWDPITRYEERRLEGWRLLIHRDLLGTAHDQVRDAMLKELGHQLYDITRAVPAPAVEKLRTIPIWIEVAHPRHPCMCYHVSPEWLKEHGMNPAKAGAVELANVKNFLSWTRQQPWMVLHELAHGYHHQVLKYNHAGVRAAYEQAKRDGTYESILHWNGKKVRHYALNNDREYFAEATEAYFGTNDYFPFVKAELQTYDPRGFELMEQVWGIKSPPKK